MGSPRLRSRWPLPRNSLPSRSRHITMASSTFKPSTIDDGYRLSPSPLKNPFTSDHVYQRILTWYLPHDIYDQISPKLEQFAAESISPQVNEWIANAEVQQPYVKQYDAWGRRYPVDKLVTSEGWKRLGEWGAKNGCDQPDPPFPHQLTSVPSELSPTAMNQPTALTAASSSTHTITSSAPPLQSAPVPSP